MLLKWKWPFWSFEAGGSGGIDTSHGPSNLIIWAVGFNHIWILKAEASNSMRATSWLVNVELRAEIRMMELINSSDELSKVRDESRHSVEETRSGIGIELGLGIDLNEIPSPSLHETLHDLFEVIRNFHDNPSPLLGGPAKLAGAENDAGTDNINHVCCSPGASGACSGLEVKGQVVICEGCEHCFHIGCIKARVGCQVLSHDEWICMECECNGVKS